MTVEVPQIQFLDGGMVGISGLGAWFDSGYMVYVSPWEDLAFPVRCLVLAQCLVRL